MSAMEKVYIVAYFTDTLLNNCTSPKKRVSQKKSDPNNYISMEIPFLGYQQPIVIIY